MSHRCLLPKLFAAIAFLLLAALLLGAAAAVLRPPQEFYGSTWRAYLAEPEDSIDVLYFGSSYAYCDFDPTEIQRHSGLTGYVLGGSEQTMSLTYWYLCQALETQSPQAVVIEPTGVFFEKYQNYTQTNIVYMPFSRYKLGAILTAAEPELRWGLLFDLWFYHSRWQEITLSGAIEALSPAEPDPYKGFTPMEGTADQLLLTQYARPLTEEQYQENLSWLLRSLALCRERDIPVVVLLNPTYSQCSPEQYEQLCSDLAAQAPDVIFVNWASCFAELGLDPTLHLYDAGHLNREGAAVYAEGVARMLTQILDSHPQAYSKSNHPSSVSNFRSSLP